MTQTTLDYLAAHRDRTLAELIEFAAIPSVSTDPAHRADIDRAAAWLAAQIAAAGPFDVQIIPTRGHPVVFAQWLGAAGQADRAGLRPLRRAAARSAGEVGQPALRAGDPHHDGPSLTAPRRVGRQGAALPGGQGGAGVLRHAGQPAGQRQVHVRGRGGDRQPQPGAVHPGAHRSAGRRFRHLGRRRHVAHQRTLGHDLQPRAGRAGVHADRGGEGSAFRPARRRGGEPAARHRRIGRQPARARRTRGGGGLLRRRGRAAAG